MNASAGRLTPRVSRAALFHVYMGVDSVSFDSLMNKGDNLAPSLMRVIPIDAGSQVVSVR